MRFTMVHVCTGNVISPIFEVVFLLICVFSQGLNGNSANGLIELVLIEARDLVAADLRGTSDPYVRIHYGSLKRRTKVRMQQS